MSRWTFSTVSFSDPNDDNSDDNASGTLRVEAITQGSVEPDDPFSVRVYWYHPSASVVVNQPQGEDATVTPTGSGTEPITETVRLTFGKGTASFPDTSGNTNVYDAAQKAEPVGYKAVTYSVNYIDYDLASPTEGEHDGVFLFSDGSNITSQGFTVPAAVFRPTTLEIYNEQTDAIVVGAAVYVDGVYLGITDSAGRITTGSLEVGTTHTLRVTASGYIDSDIDDIANDSFVAQ